MSTSRAAKAEAFNELDPHGYTAGHHGHMIVSVFTLRSVLGLLLMFTVLTVGAAQFEKYIMAALQIQLPLWINVGVALGIATIKSLLVLLFFMQLKYDNPINAVAFAFCLLGFATFLGFTILDVGNRDAVYDWKAGEIQAGGN